MAGMRIGGRGAMSGVRIDLSRLSWSYVVAGMGVGRSRAMSGVTAHVMTGVRVGLSVGGGAMLGGRRRHPCGKRRSCCGRVPSMTGVVLGQGGAACGQHQGREGQRER